MSDLRDRGSGRGDNAPPAMQDLLAHDIRAAVSDVIGGLRLIDGDRLPNAEREQVGRVHAAAELLARLVEELLVGDAGDAGLDQVAGNLNLHRFLDDELRRWRGAARPLGIGIRLDRAADLPEVVRLNGLHLRRVVSNLMANALRHGADGAVTLGADVRPDGALRICVSDEGPGFPPDLLPELGRPAVRGHRSAGTGMGLHIAAAHAEGLGGRLEMGNVEPHGARVTLTVPPDRWRREDPPPGGDLPDLTGLRVLVAEDSPTNQLLVRSMLERMGAECEVASDGIEALNWFGRERFDLAIVDIEMPRLGGLEVIRSERLRQARGVAPPMAVLAMTAYVMRDNRDAIHEAGADGILAKPLGPIETFGRTVKHYVEAAPDPSAWSPESAPPFSFATLAELMVAASAEDGPELLVRLRRDLADVEAALDAALASGDDPQVRAQTHVLIALSGAVGALPTLVAARRLNRLSRDGNVDAVRIAGKVCLARLADLRRELAAAR
jgi:CheY-like chemotaxis protein/two-component sensor histidine kinase